VIKFADRRLRSGAPCLAIRVIDALRSPLQSGHSYRSGKTGLFGRKLDALVVTIDHDIMATGKVRGCVFAGRMTKPIAPQHVGEPVKPSPVKGADEDDNEAPDLKLPKGATLFTKPGSPSSITGTKRTVVPAGMVPAVNPVRIYQRTDTVLPTHGFPQEVQVASGAGVVIASGNGSAFYSVDHGVTFSRMSPFTVFGSFQGGFCCDTVVRYAPQVQRFVWLLQGDPTTAAPNDNSYVLAVASPAAIKAAVTAHRPVESAWHIYRLTRSVFAETSTSFDFPTMGVGDHALYLTWNRVNQGVIMARLNLAQLAAGGDISIYYFKQNFATFRRIAQNSGSVGYWVFNNDDLATTGGVDYLQESSGLMFSALLPHTAIPTRGCSQSDTPGSCGYTSLTPLGEDWTIRVAGSAVKAATVRGNQLWLGWTAARGYVGVTTDVWPQAHVQYAAFRIPLTPMSMVSTDGGTSWPAVVEGNVWNPNVGIVDPAFATSSNGDIGISFSYGGPANPPSPAAGVIDPLPHELFQVIAAASVDSGGDRSQGDYSAIQPDYPNTARFVTSGYVDRLDGGSPVNHWGFMCFGRSATPSQPDDRC
jgi:hypothetical protein